MTTGISLAYDQYGQRSPLIILHGLFGSRKNWSHIGQRLAKDRTVYAVDLRNHGDSPHSSDFCYQDLLEDLKGFMDRQKIPKASLLGHSLGGKVAMFFAQVYPQMLEKLIVADIAPKPYPEVHKELIKALKALDLALVSKLSQARETLKNKIDSLAVINFLLANLRRQKDGTYAWTINLEAFDTHHHGLCSDPCLEIAIEKPVLFLKGEYSDYILPRDTDRIVTLFPHAQIQTVTNAGHWLNIDAPEATFETVSRFLDG